MCSPSQGFYESSDTLSPAAQAVLDAYWKSPCDPSLQHEDRYAIAAALQAAADQIEPDGGVPVEVREVLDHLLAIAAELETQ